MHGVRLTLQVFCLRLITVCGSDTHRQILGYVFEKVLCILRAEFHRIIIIIMRQEFLIVGVAIFQSPPGCPRASSALCLCSKGTDWLSSSRSLAPLSSAQCLDGYHGNKPRFETTGTRYNETHISLLILSIPFIPSLNISLCAKKCNYINFDCIIQRAFWH